METAVRRAQRADLDDVVATLTDAFMTEPVMSWAFPSDRVRSRRLDALWSFMAGEAYLPLGASTVAPGGDGAALWLAPGQGLGDEFWDTRAVDFVNGLEGEVERLSAISKAMAAHHPHDREHWYLLAIGVATDRQGGRLGSALLAHTLEIADADGAPAYLEATSRRSRVLYERFGFEVIAEISAAPGAPTLWSMWREPNAQASV